MRWSRRKYDFKTRRDRINPDPKKTAIDPR
jgi:hypothetical protein